jgi:DNA-binding NarL/FixJ family response regulator
MARDERRVDELADDALRLQQATRALEGRALSAGVRAQLDRFLALVAAELSRLRGAREPELWRTAASLATNDPYLRAYSLWRLGASLHALRRRRDATAVLREAYAVSREAEVRVVADMVRATARSLGVEVENETDATPRRSSPFHLTPRELEVLELLVQGLSNRRIARALFMSEKTASVHVSHILAKLSVSGRGEAVARAYEVGLASVTDE